MSENKDFLEKEPIGKLLLKLALPTLAAQFINMLYNIVDRIYIGHIPGIGASALTGVGVCMPLILIVSAFAALVGYGGAPRASIYMGKKESGPFTCVWRKREYHRICFQLYEYLCDRNDICGTDSGHECIYYRTGICKDRYVFCINRSCK